MYTLLNITLPYAYSFLPFFLIFLKVVVIYYRIYKIFIEYRILKQNLSSKLLF